MRYLLIIICLQIAFFSSAKDLVITKLSTSSIKIGNSTIGKGDIFSDGDVIYWSSADQDMKAKPKSGGLPRHYSAAAFRSKSKKSLSIKQYLMYLNKTNHPSTLSSEMELKEGRNKEKFPEKRLALVIGNSNYENFSPDLDCPISDAEDVSNKLNELGFDTFTLYDANYMDFCNSLTNLNKVAKSDEYNVVLFYYCGHGNQYNGMNYLLPSSAQNTKPEHVEGWVSFDYIFDTFENLDTAICKTRLVFLDACRNTPGWETNNLGSRLDQYKTNGAFVVFSTENNTKALGAQEEESRNTPFGSSFLETVDKPSENITLTINKLSESVKEKTAYYSSYGESPRQVYTFGVGNVNFSFVPGVNIDALINKTKYYLSLDNPEMAVVNLYRIKNNYSFLDSIQKIEFNDLVDLTNETMLKSKAYLVSIEDSTDFINFTSAINNNNETFNRAFQSYNNIKIVDDEESGIKYIIINNRNSVSDTISVNVNCSIVTNYDKTLLAAYDIITDTTKNFIPDEYNYGTGMKVISLDNGETLASVSCWAWYPWLTFPIALSNNGNFLLFKEGYREREFLWFIDFSLNQKKALYDWYENVSGYYIGGFSKDDKLFYLLTEEELSVYNTKSLEKIHTFKYNLLDNVFWEENNLCVSSDKLVFKWQFNDYQHIKSIVIPGDPIDVAINNEKNCIGAICNNGNLIIVDINTKTINKKERVIDYPSHIAFAYDNKSIWAISGYNKIIKYNIIDNNITLIKEKNEDIFHSYRSEICMLPNSHFCITSFALDNQGIRIFDTNNSMEIICSPKVLSQIFKKEFGKEQDIDKIFEELSNELFPYDETDSDEILDKNAYMVIGRRKIIDNYTTIEYYYDGTIKLISSNLPHSFIELMKTNI